MRSEDGRKVEIDGNAVSEHVLDNMACAMMSDVQSFYADPANAARYRQWLAERTTPDKYKGE